MGLFLAAGAWHAGEYNRPQRLALHTPFLGLALFLRDARMSPAWSGVAHSSKPSKNAAPLKTLLCFRDESPDALRAKVAKVSSMFLGEAKMLPLVHTLSRERQHHLARI